MNKQYEIFLETIKAALNGVIVSDSEKYRALSIGEWQGLIMLAESHKVLPMFYEAVHEVLEKADEVLAAQVRKRVVQQVMLQTMKTTEFLQLVGSLHDLGIKPLVVKGIVCRNLYPKPDERISGDEDMLISEDQFSYCQEKLLNMGFDVVYENKDREDSYEVSYKKNDNPLYLEVHKALFSTNDVVFSPWNEYFKGVHDRAVKHDMYGVSVFSLSHTDHLFYLICHAFKHFLHSGYGIRQVCDMVMYANAYGREIDWEKICANCREIRAELFTAAVFKIGQKHLNFDCDKASFPADWLAMDVDELPMLEDLLTGGIYGGADLNRKHSSNMTLNTVSGQMQGKSDRATVLKTIFPTAKSLESRYKFLKKQPYLIILAWMDRIFKYGLELVKGKYNSAADALRIGNQRVELLKIYGVVDR